jgi:hypothetical protein
MVSGCATPDLAMLRWIAYIKSLNPEIRHISGKDNAMVDMLSRARYDDEHGMVSEDEEVGVDFFETARVTTGRASTPTLNDFDAREYDGEWLLIRRFLRTMTSMAEWTKEEANRIRKKAYRFFLHDGYMWKHPKKRGGAPLRVIVKGEEQKELLAAFHDSPWAGHRGAWATFEKLKERYWWPGLYTDVHRFVLTCETCQMHSRSDTGMSSTRPTLRRCTSSGRSIF